jgi:hypothetical protein
MSLSKGFQGKIRAERTGGVPAVRRRERRIFYISCLTIVIGAPLFGAGIILIALGFGVIGAVMAIIGFFYSQRFLLDISDDDGCV